MFDLVIVALLQAAAGEAAPAPEQAPQAQTQAAEAQTSAEPAKRCRTEETTGSRVRNRRVCETAEQRARRTRNSQEGMVEMTRRAGPTVSESHPSSGY